MEKEKLATTVKKAQQGDSAALIELYDEMYDNVYYLALRLLKIPEDAEDITQEIYITVHEKVSGLREPAAFFGWVNKITATTCYQLLRKNKGIEWLDENVLQEIEEDNISNLPDKAIDDEATRKIILDVIDNLPEPQRVCVMLYYYVGNSIAEIAEILEAKEGTVSFRLHAARAKIKAALEEKEKKEGIKLWGIPLSLFEILQEDFENYTIPSDTKNRIRNSISNIAALPIGNVFVSTDMTESQQGDDIQLDLLSPENISTETGGTDVADTSEAEKIRLPPLQVVVWDRPYKGQITCSLKGCVANRYLLPLKEAI